MIRNMLGRAARPAAAQLAPRVPSIQIFPSRSFHGSIPGMDKNQEELDRIGPGFIDKYQLYEPSRYVPIGVGAFGTLTATGMYHWNAESQLLGLFLLFVGTIYAKGGPAIHAALTEAGDNIMKEQNALEEQAIEALRETKAVQEEMLDIYSAPIELFENRIKLLERLMVVQPSITREKAHQQIERLMAIYSAQESKLQRQTEAQVVDSATDAVRDAFSADANLRASAMDAAFLSLANPDSRPKQDVVGQLYSNYFEQLRATSWNDRANNPVVDVSSKSKDDAEAIKKIMAGALDLKPSDPSVAEYFPSLKSQYDLVKDGMEGAILSENVKSDPRYKTASEENKKFMTESEFKAWESK